LDASANVGSQATSQGLTRWDESAQRSVVRQRLVASMTSLCKEMGMQVVAEGVETAEEDACVREIGCDLLQGYLFAKPGRPFPSVDMGR
jgi:EAL domain-containing protein (putative c-di-GMP-specific phosphodiesterase class I)